MTTTTFTDQETTIEADWLNDVNSATYKSVVPLAQYCVGDNTTDDYANLQALINTLSAAGGGAIVCQPGKTYRLSTAPIIKDNVTILMRGATFRCVLVGTGGYDYGIRLRSNAWLIGGTVSIESSGVLGSQGGIHAAINVGPLYGDGGTVASPSADEGVSGWGVRDMTLKTNASGKTAVQIVGGANRGTIENVYLPASSVMSGIHLDWGYLGTINSSDIPTSRTNFNAGTAYTTHPHRIKISNITIGALSYPYASGGTYGVRLSGVYDVTVDGVDVASTTYAGFFHTAGDCGFEFAPAAVKLNAHKLLRIRNVNIKDATASWGFFVDCYADNVAAAVGGGYVPLLPPIAPIDISFRHCRTASASGASASDGWRVQNCIGGVYEECEGMYHNNGFLVDTGGDRGTVYNCCFTYNRVNGIYIHHGSDNPDGWVVEGCFAGANATDAGSGNNAGFRIGSALNTRLVHNKAGMDTETTQSYGFYVAPAGVGTALSGNHVAGIKAGGTGYTAAGSTDYGVIDYFRDNTWAAGVGTPYAGVNILPISIQLDPIGGTKCRVFRARRATLTGDITPPAAFAALVGDRIEYADPTFAGNVGTVATAAGSPGTWHAYGALV